MVKWKYYQREIFLLEGGLINLKESGENYLETILILHNRRGYVRSIDIANELGYTKPSVSRAISILKEGGYIQVEHGGNIILTPLGMEKASKLYERHTVLTELLRDVLGVDGQVANDDACRIEHIISQQTFEHIRSFVEAQREKKNN